jgi:hypothetical protein
MAEKQAGCVLTDDDDIHFGPKSQESDGQGIAI